MIMFARQREGVTGGRQRAPRQYLNFTHMVRGRPVALSDGRWDRAPILGPGDVRSRPLGGISSYVPVSLSARDLSYLWHCQNTVATEIVKLFFFSFPFIYEYQYGSM